MFSSLGIYLHQPSTSNYVYTFLPRTRVPFPSWMHSCHVARTVDPRLCEKEKLGLGQDQRINAHSKSTVIKLSQQRPGLCYTVFTFILFSSKTDILIPKTRSWISDDDFATIINLSLSSTMCCNVYLSDSVDDSEVLFNQFKRTYKYEYLLNRSSYKCDGYFLLSSREAEIAKFMEKLSLKWKTEVLVILNNYVSNDSIILNHFLYQMANVNIVSLSGVWKLSQNYLKSRSFIRINRYDEMRHDYANINLHGRELRVCSVYRPPMTYLNNTANKTIDGVQMEVFTVKNDLEKDGVEMQLFLIMAEKLNFTWTIQKPEGIYMYGRRVNETEWKGGMIQMIRDNKADIAFGSIWLTQDQNMFVHLSEPWYQLFIHFLVPRPQRTTSFWALTRPFTKEIWYLFLSMILSHSLYTYTRAWIDPMFPKRFRNFLITLMDLIGCLLSSSVPKTIRNNKLQILLWRTAGWLIITAYCSSLAARLASSEYESRIDTIEQFLLANLTWGKTGQVPPFRDYFDLTDPYSAQLPSRYRYVESDRQSRDLIAQGNYAIFGKIVDKCFFPDDYISNEDLKHYRLMKQSVGSFYAAFALQPWLLEPVNRIILYLKETGITIWHLRDIIRKRDSYNLREVLQEHDGYDGSVQVLGLTPLGAGFSLLLVGSSIAILVFYVELKRAAKSTSIREVLRRIDGKRRSRESE
ncbi:uncharacterized protein LOC143186286 [Calliopsis andreniformis]|uniref:uncharacterized protein LOC143186286 n=1 Tax=Calliopsis andreniformis TaxID=337506 RepID=UPI003FCD88D3